MRPMLVLRGEGIFSGAGSGSQGQSSPLAARNPLSEPELAAVEQGLVAYEKLIEKLADAPTPDRLYEVQIAPALQANNGDN